MQGFHFGSQIGHFSKMSFEVDSQFENLSIWPQIFLALRAKNTISQFEEGLIKCGGDEFVKHKNWNTVAKRPVIEQCVIGLTWELWGQWITFKFENIIYCHVTFMFTKIITTLFIICLINCIILQYRLLNSKCNLYILSKR